MEPTRSHLVAAVTTVAQPSGKPCDFSLWWLTKRGAAMVVGSRHKKTLNKSINTNRDLKASHAPFAKYWKPIKKFSACY